MVMELAEGQGLNEVLAENEPLEIRDALRLALDLGGAIETLHNLGIVHAGLRPCNVRILPQGRVKLMDLEIAGLRGAPELRDLVVEGSPADYLAPEQVRGAPLSDKTDVYAFGLTLYELLCGAPPFRSSSRDATLSAQLDEAPPRMRRRRRGIPKGVQTLVTPQPDVPAPSTPAPSAVTPAVPLVPQPSVTTTAPPPAEAPPAPTVNLPVAPAPSPPAATLPVAPVAPSPAATVPVPATPPLARELRAPAAPRVDPRPAPEKPSIAPERSAAAPQRPTRAIEQPAGAAERDDADGGAAIDWLLKRPGGGTR
jgi:serine/threonine-protein kinase